MPQTNRHNWKVFIASSSEAINAGVVLELAEALTSQDIEPIRWDSREHFPAGDLTLSSLLDAFNLVDAAVFVLHSDDLLIRGYQNVRQRPECFVAGRDNVLFEYGLGVRALGPHKCFGLYERNVREISDLSGITHQRYDQPHSLRDEGGFEALRDVCAKLARTIRSKLDSPPPAGEERLLRIRSSRSLWDGKDSPYPPTHWNQRCLYIGREGARGWLKLAGSEAYMPRPTAAALQMRLSKLCEDIEPLPGIVVSLGCGDARTDLSLLAALRNRTPHLTYLPVDINETLLRNAMVKAARLSVQVPEGYQLDFEDDGLEVLEEALKSFPKLPKLFVLLGGTITNLDSPLSTFLRKLASIMGEEDHFIFDAALKHENYSEAEDISARAAGAPMSRDQINERRWLVAHAVSRRWGKTIDSVLEHYDQLIEYAAEVDIEVANSTVIATRVKPSVLPSVSQHPGAALHAFPHSVHDTRVYGMRRFHLESFCDFLGPQGLDLVNRESIGATRVVRHERLIDMGFFHCRRRLARKSPASGDAMSHRRVTA